MEITQNDDGRKGEEEGSEPEPWWGRCLSLGKIKLPHILVVHLSVSAFKTKSSA